jgi:hypothetical protein
MPRCEQVGDWYFAVREARNHSPDSPGDRYLAWCAKTPDLGDGPLDVDWSRDDVHAEFAESEDAALTKLKREVLN